MKNLKVRVKLIVSFAIVAVMAVSIGGVGIYGMRQIQSSGNYMYEYVVQPMPHLSKTIETLLVIRIHVREMAIASLLDDFTTVEREFSIIGSLLPVLEGHMNNFRDYIVNYPNLLGMFDEAKAKFDNELVPVVLGIYAASQTADVSGIRSGFVLCNQYANEILENFSHCFDYFVVYAESASDNSSVLGRTLLTAILAVLSVTFVATIFLAIYISGMISRPLDLLVKAFEKVAVGDLTQRIPDKGKDEIAQASKAYNTTMDEFSKMVKSVIKQSSQLSSIGNDLSTNMNETATAVREITANIQNIKGRIINQSASVAETHATMEQLVINVNKLGNHVEAQAANVSQASSAIEEMVANIHSVTETLVQNNANVHNLEDASNVGRAGLQDVVTDIQEIARESEGLLEINAVMENIASQTNLLSMNAAIEAAHAGEAGKGFAVVAEEIRKLAENSSEQSKTISDVLKKIKSSIDKITKSTDYVLQKFEAIETGVKTVAQQENNIRNAMEEQETGSKQILDGVANVNEITRQVKGGSDEMREGAQEVIRESQNLSKSTEDITSGMNDMAMGADQINLAVNHVNEISGKNREAIDVLVKEVSRFKVA